MKIKILKLYWKTLEIMKGKIHIFLNYINYLLHYNENEGLDLSKAFFGTNKM